MRKLYKFSIEIPLEFYENLVLLVEEGYYNNLREAVAKALEKELQSYDESLLNSLRKKHKDLIKEIRKARSVRTRGVPRRWNPKKKQQET